MALDAGSADEKEIILLTAQVLEPLGLYYQVSWGVLGVDMEEETLLHCSGFSGL